MRETHRNLVLVVGMYCMCMCRASRKCVERDSVSASSAHMCSASINAKVIYSIEMHFLYSWVLDTHYNTLVASAACDVVLQGSANWSDAASWLNGE